MAFCLKASLLYGEKKEGEGIWLCLSDDIWTAVLESGGIRKIHGLVDLMMDQRRPKKGFERKERCERYVVELLIQESDMVRKAMGNMRAWLG